MPSLAEKVRIVTVGVSGIALATALAMANAGSPRPSSATATPKLEQRSFGQSQRLEVEQAFR